MFISIPGRGRTAQAEGGRFIRYSLMIVLSCIGRYCVSVAAGAQPPPPGSAAYNSVRLPAHGVGGTSRAPKQMRWGALVAGKGGVLGWTTEADSAQGAAAEAMDRCSVRQAQSNAKSLLPSQTAVPRWRRILQEWMCPPGSWLLFA